MGARLGALRAGEVSSAQLNHSYRRSRLAWLFITGTLQVAAWVAQVKVLGAHTLRIRPF